MLGGIYYMLLLLAILLLSGSESMVAYAKIYQTHLANSQAEDVLQSAQAQLLSSIRVQVQTGTAPASLQAPTYQPISLCAEQSNPGAGPAPSPSPSACTHAAAATFTLSGATGSSTGTATTADNLNTTVDEGRVSFNVVATVDQNGAAIATRVAQVTYDTFNEPPYAKEADELDLNGSAQTSTQGDSVGCDPANPLACDTGATAAVGNTRTQVNPQCQGDPTECSYAGADGYAPVNNYQTTTWNSTDATTSAVPH